MLPHLIVALVITEVAVKGFTFRAGCQQYLHPFLFRRMQVEWRGQMDRGNHAPAQTTNCSFDNKHGTQRIGVPNGSLGIPNLLTQD